MSHDQTMLLEADLTWTGREFEPGVQVAVGSDGLIRSVEKVRGSRPGDPQVTRLHRRALLPGFVNVHSHAFQRGLRGQGDTFPAGMQGPGGNFWTWREAMYALVDRLDFDSLYQISRQCFEDMLRAGITTVGEFHYVHHDGSGAGYALDEAVVKAAADAGIRMVLLQTYYRTGGIGKELAGGQRRFATRSVAEYWNQFDRMASLLDARTQSMGAVAHSIRAATIEEIAEIHAESVKRGLVFHIHVEEVVGEIADCVAAYDRRPMRLYLERLKIDERFTAIHCTHTLSDDLGEFARRGATVGLCPLTEGNLGDGIPKLMSFIASGGRVAIGTDLNSRHSVFEELRWIEYVQRLSSQSRGVLRDEEGRVARPLLQMATMHGAQSLGMARGRGALGTLAAGAAADFVEIRLDSPSLAGFAPETLAESLIFGAGDAEIAATWVAGRRVWNRD